MDSNCITNQTAEELLIEKNADLRSTVLPVTIFFGVVMVCGFIGNLLTMYVFFFRYKPCNFRYFVLGLALTDFVSCLTTIPGEMVSWCNWYNYTFPVLCKVKDLFNQATVLSEAMFLICIAVDRYLKVCRPFGRQITLKMAYTISIAIIILSFILAIPTPIFWGTRHETQTKCGRSFTVTLCETDDKFYGTMWPFGNVLTYGSIVCFADAFVVVMYILVGRTHHIVRRRNRQLTTQSSDTGVDLSEVSNGTSAPLNRVSTPHAQSQSHDDETNTSDNDHTAVSPTIGGIFRRSSADQRTEMRRIARNRSVSLLGFYLTAIFIITTVVYWSMLSVVANGILDDLSDVEKPLYFFFLRLYFINHCINPVLYGLLDPRFKAEMRSLKSRLTGYKCVYLSREG